METMAIGVSTTLVGMLIVFSVLCLLAVILSVFKLIAGEGEQSHTESNDAPQAIPAAAPPDPSPLQHVDSDADSELVAVIASAIAASLNTQADKLIVRSFRKVSNWSENAKRESMGFQDERHVRK